MNQINEQINKWIDGFESNRETAMKYPCVVTGNIGTQHDQSDYLFILLYLIIWS